MIKKICIGLAGTVALVAALLATHVMSIDNIHGTHGVSIGGNNQYCSIELNTDAHGGGLDFWCQNAG